MKGLAGILADSGSHGLGWATSPFSSGCDTRLPLQGHPQISAECGDADIQVMCLGSIADNSVLLGMVLGFPFTFGPFVSFPSSDWVSQRYILGHILPPKPTDPFIAVKAPLNPVFMLFFDVLGLTTVGFPHQPGMEVGLSSAHGLPMRFTAFAIFLVARRRSPIHAIYPMPLSELIFTGLTCMATLEYSQGFLTYFTRFASSLAVLTFFSLAKEIFSLTTAAPDSGLESQSVSFEFLSQASEYIGAKGADHAGLPPRQ